MAENFNELKLLRQELEKSRRDADERAREEERERAAVLIREADENARMEERQRATELMNRIRQEISRSRTPSPVRPAVVPYEQTPRTYTTSSSYNTSENRSQIDNALKTELRESLLINNSNLISKFFPTTEREITIFETLKQGANPLYKNEDGWTGWPVATDEGSVLGWFRETYGRVKQLAIETGLATHEDRIILTPPNRPRGGHGSPRKLDIGLVHDTRMQIGHHQYEHVSLHEPSACYDWSQVLVVGELKQNVAVDNSENTWLNLNRYVRTVFKEQDIRLFTLGFTLCGPNMRLWYYDRVGGVASQSFDIHKDGQTLVSVLCGFLAMNEAQLGYDPTIKTDDRGSFITIIRENRPERINLVRQIRRQSGIVGRATTCWEGLLDDLPVCVKDSWQYPERPNEGNLLKHVTEHGARNVARYYHHEILEKIEDLRNGLGGSGRNVLRSEVGNASQTESSRSTSSSRKRQGSSLASPRPAKKRSLVQSGEGNTRNRERRRLITLDIGKDIRRAANRAAMIRGAIACISGLEQCFDAGVMHCDISVGNMMLCEDEHDGFLIDLDVAVPIERDTASGAPTKTGTKVFMSIGVLKGSPHTFMDDLESTFWALLWICAHCAGPGEERIVRDLEQWNYDDISSLVLKKAGLVCQEGALESFLKQHVSDYYQPFIPWLMRLSTLVFPNRDTWKQEDRNLFMGMKRILEDALKDGEILRG